MYASTARLEDGLSLVPRSHFEKLDGSMSFARQNSFWEAVHCLANAPRRPSSVSGMHVGVRISMVGSGDDGDTSLFCLARKETCTRAPTV